jgi:predicted permease
MLSDWLNTIRLRLRTLVRRDDVEHELAKELEFHLQAEIEDNLSRGMDREEAERAARRALGGLQQVAEECRDARRVQYAEQLFHDIRYSLRSLRNNPGFTAVAVISLALGIGATTAVFSFLNGLVLKQLPVGDPDRLALVARHVDRFGATQGTFSYPFYRDLFRQSHSFSGVLARAVLPMSLAFDGLPLRVDGEFVSGSYFRVLGVRPALGRLLTEEDDGAEGAHPVCVISHRLWKERFLSDPAIVSRRITLNGLPFEIVGVAEAGFDGSALQARADLQVPMAQTAQLWGERRDYTGWSWLQIMARLRPGVPLGRAQAEVQTIGTRLEAAGLTSKWEGGRNPWLLLPGAQGFDAQRARLEKPAFILLAAVALLLLIACMNLAGLLLARGLRRRHEIILRLSLGASRARVVRQFLTESLMLSLAGGACGLVVARVLTRVFSASLAAGQDNVFLRIEPDARVLAICFVLSCLTGLVVGLVPAFQATGIDLMSGLKGRTERAARRQGTRRGLVIAQVALSVVLLSGAGLLARTVRNLKTANLGFVPENVALLSISPGSLGYDDAAVLALTNSLLDRVRSLPGVQAASVANASVLSGTMSAARVRVAGHVPHGEEPNNHFNIVSSDYFRTLRIPRFAGREFSARDTKGAPPVAIVNRRMADHYWPGENPVGRHFRWGGGLDVEVVGLVGTTKYESVRGDAPPTFYLALAQRPGGDVTLHVRTSANPNRLLPVLQEQLRTLDPRLAGFRATTLEDQRDAALSSERLLSGLSVLFGAMCLLLCAIGLYGLMAYVAGSELKEIGIRLALGATPLQVIRPYALEAAGLVATGLLLGIPCAIAATRVLDGILFGLRPNDPLTLLLALLVMLAATAAAAFLPVHRAAHEDPNRVLRLE